MFRTKLLPYIPYASKMGKYWITSSTKVSFRNLSGLNYANCISFAMLKVVML